MSYISTYSIYRDCANIIFQEQDKRKNKKNPYYVSPKPGKPGRVRMTVLRPKSKTKTRC